MLGRAQGVTTPNLLRVGGWNVRTLAFHIANRLGRGESGQEIVRSLEGILEPDRKVALEAALKKCGLDPSGDPLGGSPSSR